ncbi:MAG: U32 family peptidase [Eubacteriales bacterium]|nr:U32 family peptidase [Lachnospiraceae bacterium]MDO5128076.1 U32 family peptidase [Eubacteriales bacterium]
MRHPELLIPAGDLETLKIAVMYGADAVYVGGELFSLRAKAKNFTIGDLKEGVAFAHAHGVRVYIAFNIFAFNGEIVAARDYLYKLREVMPDAFIVSDLSLFMMIKEILPEVEIHVSTQWNNTNYETFLFWYELGARKVVVARELSIEEIRQIRAYIPDDMQIECFIHGAMCIAYSGKCQLSSCFTGRDSNHGACTHPCRWKFALYEACGSPGEKKQISDDYAYFMNSKDLCMIEHIPDLIQAGVDSFKIEGRMKTVLYVATVARTYRMALDAYMRDPNSYKELTTQLLEEISKGTYRDYTTGFFYGEPNHDAQIYDNNVYVKNYTYLGYVEAITKEGYAVITQRNKFYVGDTIEVMKPDGRNLVVTVKAIYDENMNLMESCPHPKQCLFLDLGEPLSEYDVLRKQDE